MTHSERVGEGRARLYSAEVDSGSLRGVTMLRLALCARHYDHLAALNKQVRFHV